MSEEIVACPGCGKKFRIPDGAPPGSFACTACGADVGYGAAATAARPARGGGGGQRGGGKRGGGGGKRGGGGRGARRARGRRAREEAEAPDDEGRGGRRRGQPVEKENKTAPVLIAIMGVVLLIGVLIIAFTGDPPNHDIETATAPGVDTTAGGITSSNGETPIPGATDPDGSGGGTETPAETTPIPVVQPPVDPSGIGSSEGGEALPKDYRWWSHRDDDLLFEKCTPVDGTTDAEAEEFERTVVVFLDMSSGGDGMRAGRSLEKAGFAAFPHLMNGFVQQYNGDKWTTEADKWASWQCQQVARRMIKATPGPPSLEARFSPGVDVEPEKFYRAARMWISWWKGVGAYRTDFEKFEDEE